MYIQLIIIIIAFLALKWYPQNKSFEQNEKNHKKYIIFMMVLLILQSGLRHVTVGADTFTYYNIFLDVQASSWSSLWQDCLNFYYYGEGKDPGYHFLLKAIQLVLPTFQLYLIGLAVFVFYGLGRLFIRYTKSNYEVLVAISLFQCLYYSFFSITGLRQSMATGFLFLAIPFVEKKKPLQFFLLVMIAATQHKSALLFAPFYYLPIIKNSRAMLIASLVSFVPMWIYGGSVLGDFMVGTTFEQYAGYLKVNEKAGAYGFTAYILLLGSLLVYYYKKIRSNNPDGVVIILNAVAVAIVLTPLTMIDPSNMRVVQYYSIFALFALPWVVSKFDFIKNIETRYIVVTLLLTLYTMSRNAEYTFFWQELSGGINY